MNNVLCSVAWTDLVINLNQDQIKYCCKAPYVDLPKDYKHINDNPYILNTRKDLINGTKTKNCDSCNKSYEMYNTAYRDVRNAWKSVNDVSDELQYIEIIFDNICNMSCIYCSPGQSHLIAKEFKIYNKPNILPNEKLYAIVDWLSKSNLSKDFHLGFLGGEITQSKNFYNFLDILISNNILKNKNLNLVFITNANLSIDKYKKFQTVLNKIPENWKIFMSISNEATEELSEIVRWGLSWDRFTTNLRNWANDPKISAISFMLAVSMFTVSGLYDYMNWTIQLSRTTGKKIYFSGNWVEGRKFPSIFYAKKERVLDIEKVKTLINSNIDVLADPNNIKNINVWLDSLSSQLGKFSYSEFELDSYLNELCERKQSDRVYKLKNYL